MLYDGTYYKIGLIDISLGIIDNGEVALTYHPHGDSSIYETLVVMSQDFKKGLPLVDGHGSTTWLKTTTNGVQLFNGSKECTATWYAIR